MFVTGVRGWVRENDPVMAAELQCIYRSEGVSPPKPTS